MASSILIVEDEPSIAELISVNLSHEGFLPVRAFQADQAAMLMKEVLPDLIVLDWMLPGKSGIQFAKDIRNNERTKDIPIIFLTARAEEMDKIAGLDAGADDYLTKPFSPKELVARIRAILRRKSPQLNDDVMEINLLKLDPATHRVIFQGDSPQKIDLGPTEFRLLRFLMANPERVHARGQLLDKVWGDHVFVEERTVDVHIKRLRAALAPVGCETMIETVRGSGYRLTRNPAIIS
ncbi:MAG: phosphate regulon transcriptional regulator PhoB [Betaproteobacteria bacterium]